MSRGKRTAVTAALASALVMLFGGVAAAQTSGGVTVSVKPNVVGITIADGTVGFGNQNVNTTVDTNTDHTAVGGDANGAQTVTNNGGLAVTSLTAAFDAANEATCGTGTWQANAATAGTDVFVLNADSDNEFTTNLINIPPDQAPSAEITRGGGIAASGGTATIDFQIKMPTSVTTGNNACTMPLTLTAASA